MDIQIGKKIRLKFKLFFFFVVCETIAFFMENIKSNNKTIIHSCFYLNTNSLPIVSICTMTMSRTMFRIAIYKNKFVFVKISQCGQL